MISDSANNGGSNGDPTNPYPDGWFWAAELMKQKYVSAPNMIDANAPGVFLFPRDSVFRCPEGTEPENHEPFAGTSAQNIGKYPRDVANSIPVYGVANNRASTRTSLTRSPRGISSTASPRELGCVLADRHDDSPFLFFNSNQNGKPTGSGIAPGMGGQLAFAGYQRKVTMIKKPGLVCMVAEAAGSTG
jgi:hypothetical protein